MKYIVVHTYDINRYLYYKVRCVAVCWHYNVQTLISPPVLKLWDTQGYLCTLGFLAKISFTPLHRGAFCQFSFRWIYSCYCSKSTWEETGKTHHCALSYHPGGCLGCQEKQKSSRKYNLYVWFAVFQPKWNEIKKKTFFRLRSILTVNSGRN